MKIFNFINKCLFRIAAHHFAFFLRFTNVHAIIEKVNSLLVIDIFRK